MKDPKNPIPGIALFDKEDYAESSVWRERLASFRKAKLNQVFGISWNELLELPRWQVLAMFEEAEIDAKSDNQTLSQLDALK